MQIRMADSSTVGIIANSAAGKDIWRLVTQGRFVPNQEKVNILRRIRAEPDPVGIKQILVIPDSAMVEIAVLDKTRPDPGVQTNEMLMFSDEHDSTCVVE